MEAVAEAENPIQWDAPPQGPIFTALREFRQLAEKAVLATSCPADALVVRHAPLKNVFLKGLRWSPDGTCLLSCSEDNIMRVWDLPLDVLDRPPEPQLPEHDTLPASLRVAAGEAVYDFCWYPGMNVAAPASCAFVTTARAHPIQLLDALSGAHRATYRGYNDKDENDVAFSVAFTPDGGRLLGGYAGALRAFDTGRPGRDCDARATAGRGRDGQRGILSSLALSGTGGGAGLTDLLAVGSYDRTVGLYDASSLSLQSLLRGHTGGVTRVLFSPDGWYLYAGARMDGAISCWDVRQTGGLLHSLNRDAGTTNQRIEFCIEPRGRFLISGGQDGRVRVFDLRTGEAVTAGGVRAAGSCLAALDVHSSLPVLATGCGGRVFGDNDTMAETRGGANGAPDSDGDAGCDEDAEEAAQRRGLGTNHLRLWRFSMGTGATPQADQ